MSQSSAPSVGVTAYGSALSASALRAGTGDITALTGAGALHVASTDASAIACDGGAVLTGALSAASAQFTGTTGSDIHVASTDSAAITCEGGALLDGELSAASAVLTATTGTALQVYSNGAYSITTNGGASLLGSISCAGDVHSGTLTVDTPPYMAVSAPVGALLAEVSLSGGGTPVGWTRAFFCASGAMSYSAPTGSGIYSLVCGDISGVTLDITGAPGTLIAQRPTEWPGFPGDHGLIAPAYRPSYDTYYATQVEDASAWYNGFVIVHTTGMVEWQLAPAATLSAPNFTATDINIKPLVISWVVLPFSPPSAPAPTPASAPTPAAHSKAAPRPVGVAAATLAAALAAVPAEDLTASKMAIVEERVIARLSAKK